MARTLQGLTVASASANVDPDTTAAWIKVDLTPNDKAFRIMCTCTGASGTAVIGAYLRASDGTAIYPITGTATASAGRVGADGASGNYEMTLAMHQTGNEYVDAAGYVKPNTRLPGNVLSPDGQEWWVGVISMATITSVTFTVEPVQDI